LFGDNLKELRKVNKLTQSQLGKMVGVSGAYIQQLEKGIKRNPSMQLLINLLNKLLTIPWLLFRDDEELWNFYNENIPLYLENPPAHRRNAEFTQEELEFREMSNWLKDYGFMLQLYYEDGLEKLNIKDSDGVIIASMLKDDFISSYKEIIEKIKPFVRYTIENELKKSQNDHH
jgi:transcriptional regulator with XRE-family HTH domain